VEGAGGGAGSSPPAWHDDPWDPSQLRWWDGGEWSGHTYPKGEAAPAAPPAAGSSMSLPWLVIGIAGAIVVVVLGVILLSGSDPDPVSPTGDTDVVESDSDAQSAARNAQTAMEAVATDQNGSYAGIDAADLATVESSLADLPILVQSSKDGYTVQVGAASGAVFSITRASDGATAYGCTPPGEGSCPPSGDWAP